MDSLLDFVFCCQGIVLALFSVAAILVGVVIGTCISRYWVRRVLSSDEAVKERTKDVEDRVRRMGLELDVHLHRLAESNEEDKEGKRDE